MPVVEADAALLGTADLVVVGGPTHAHGMSRADTRTGAMIASSDEPGATFGLDVDAEGPGLREWFSSLGQLETNAAAFDTRVDRPAAFTGRLSNGIGRKLRHHGATLVAEPRSFLVTKANRLEPTSRHAPDSGVTGSVSTWTGPATSSL